MIIVTGGAGFIGSNIVKALNDRGAEDILVVDNLTKGEKFVNLADCRIADYLDKEDFITRIQGREDVVSSCRALFHLGACSATTEWDGRYMMHNNYRYSKELLHWCLARRVPFLYASSASVYGAGPVFSELPRHERVLNVYGYSKLLFDQYVRRVLSRSKSQIVGFRYFNVYGPREQHKGSMASVAYHFNKQIRETGRVRLFEGTDGYDDGEQKRDFIYVGDAVNTNLWFLNRPQQSGIFNLGTGRAEAFNAVARAVIAWYGHGEIEYIPFPEHLKGRYQSFTRADMSKVRATGFDETMRTVEEGVKAYLDWLNATPASSR